MSQLIVSRLRYMLYRRQNNFVHQLEIGAWMFLRPLKSASYFINVCQSCLLFFSLQNQFNFMFPSKKKTDARQLKLNSPFHTQYSMELIDIYFVLVIGIKVGKSIKLESFRRFLIIDSVLERKNKIFYIIWIRIPSDSYAKKLQTFTHINYGKQKYV